MNRVKIIFLMMIQDGITSGCFSKTKAEARNVGKTLCVA